MIFLFSFVALILRVICLQNCNTNTVITLATLFNHHRQLLFSAQYKPMCHFSYLPGLKGEQWPLFLCRSDLQRDNGLKLSGLTVAPV